MATETKGFSSRHKIFGSEKQFTELNAPDWLTSINTRPGSTMDYRWFWKDHCLTLHVGESIETDFHVITRVR